MPRPEGLGEGRRPIGVVGCGTMGAGIAEAAARAGYQVEVRVLDDRHASEARQRIAGSLHRARETSRIEAQDVQRSLEHISFHTSLDALAGVDLVVEAIPERLEAKRDLFRELAEACPGAVLASNTSSLPVIELAVAAGSPDRVVGLHFFNPAPAMKLVELAETVATSPEASATARRFAESLGKNVVACRDRAGFIANLLLFPYLNEAVKIVDAGYATAETVDTAMKLGAGHPMGPLELIDLVGLDACMQILESLNRQFAEPRFVPSPGLRQLVAAGFTGRKAGRGFHVYAGPDGPRIEADEPVRGPGASPGPPSTRGTSPGPPSQKSTSPGPPPQGWPGTSPGPPSRESTNIGPRLGVVGTGAVGSGLAEAAASAGLPITCWGRSDPSCGRARDAVERSSARALEKGRLSERERERLLDRIHYTTDIDRLAECDFVVEAVAEDLELKRSLFAELDGATKPDAVLATATSSLSVIDIASATGRADRVIGFHAFNPVPAMKLIEVVRTVATTQAAVDAAIVLCERLGKTPVVCSDRAGFIVNRLLFPYLNDAVRMLEEGYASAEDIDTAMTLGCNHPVGPLALIDLVGLDVTLEIARSLHRELLDPGYAPVPLLEHMVRAGFLGKKSGRGFRHG
jgi:3-hydroxybutyryl-CoA dehydrogenase